MSNQSDPDWFKHFCSAILSEQRLCELQPRFSTWSRQKAPIKRSAFCLDKRALPLINAQEVDGRSRWIQTGSAPQSLKGVTSEAFPKSRAPKCQDLWSGKSWQVCSGSCIQSESYSKGTADFNKSQTVKIHLKYWYLRQNIFRYSFDLQLQKKVIPRVPFEVCFSNCQKLHQCI